MRHIARHIAMIKLKKTAKPQILVDYAQDWTNDYLDCLKKGNTPSDTIKNRYKHPEIKKALKAETHEKCAYCESKITHIDYGDVEHILPKNKNARPDLYVDWDNLTFTCTRCNRDGKKDYFNPKAPLINPYVDDPDNYFKFVSNFIHPKNTGNPNIAQITIDTIKLNRLELAERRKEVIEEVRNLLLAWNTAADSIVKATLHHTLQEYCNPDKEYSAFVRHFLLDNGFVFV